MLVGNAEKSYRGPSAPVRQHRFQGHVDWTERSRPWGRTGNKCTVIIGLWGKKVSKRTGGVAFIDVECTVAKVRRRNDRV